MTAVSLALACGLTLLSGWGCRDGQEGTPHGGKARGEEAGDSKTRHSPRTGSTGSSERPRHRDEVRGAGTFAFRPAPSGAQPERGGVAVLALLNDPDSLNPFTCTTREAHDVQDLIFPRLAHEQPDYDKGPPSFKPGLATSWKPAEDNLSLRFTLREAQWSDGRPITADDVLFSWQAANDPQVAWVSKSIVAEITRVEVHSPRDLTLHYTRHYAYQLMDACDMVIIPKHVFGKIPFDRWRTHGSWAEEAKVSGAPWRLTEVKPKQQIVLERNPHYWEPDKPYLERVVFRIIPSLDTLMTAFLTKDVDFIQAVVPEKVQAVLEDDDLLLYTFFSRAYGAIGWNNSRWPFDDARVRRAMTLAIDRENIVESLFYGYAKVPASYFISTLWAHDPSSEALAYDPDGAEDLLREAGFRRNADGKQEKDGKVLRFQLVTNAENDLRKQIIEYAKNDLEKIGVEVQLHTMDGNQFFTQLRAHDFDAGMHGMGNATKVDFKPVWHSAGAEGGFNLVNFRNQRVDELIDRARHMVDLEASRPLWHEVQKILREEQPETMIYEQVDRVGLHKRFVNVRMTALRSLDNVHEWWVPAADRLR